MVSADAPRGARTAWPMLVALVVELGATFVPELGASTMSYSCIAKVAWTSGERVSRGCCWCVSRRKNRVWVRGPCHGWLQLSIPQRTRSNRSRTATCFGDEDGFLPVSRSSTVLDIETGPSAYRETCERHAKESSSLGGGTTTFYAHGELVGECRGRTRGGRSMQVGGGS